MHFTKTMVMALILVMLPLTCLAGDFEEFAVLYRRGFGWDRYPATLKMEAVDGPGLVRGAICRELKIWGKEKMMDIRFEAEVKKSPFGKALKIDCHGANHVRNILSPSSPANSIDTWTAYVRLTRATGQLNQRLAKAFLKDPKKPILIMEGEMSLERKYKGSRNTYSVSKALFIPVSELKQP